ncbi:MAG: hypothetical protein HP498_03535 [Nitrospira sp.]|nr:hypothetical protein [Nitrospira sp.]
MSQPFAQRGQESFEEAQEELFADDILADQETDAVQEQENEGKEREQGEKCKRCGQAGAAVP